MTTNNAYLLLLIFARHQRDEQDESTCESQTDMNGEIVIPINIYLTSPLGRLPDSKHSERVSKIKYHRFEVVSWDALHHHHHSLELGNDSTNTEATTSIMPFCPTFVN